MTINKQFLSCILNTKVHLSLLYLIFVLIIFYLSIVCNNFTAFGIKNIFRMQIYAAFIFSTVRKYGACGATDSQNIYIYAELRCVLFYTT